MSACKQERCVSDPILLPGMPPKNQPNFFAPPQKDLFVSPIKIQRSLSSDYHIELQYLDERERERVCVCVCVSNTTTNATTRRPTSVSCIADKGKGLKGQRKKLVTQKILCVKRNPSIASFFKGISFHLNAELRCCSPPLVPIIR